MKLLHERKAVVLSQHIIRFTAVSVLQRAIAKVTEQNYNEIIGKSKTTNLNAGGRAVGCSCMAMVLGKF